MTEQIALHMDTAGNAFRGFQISHAAFLAVVGT